MKLHGVVYRKRRSSLAPTAAQIILDPQLSDALGREVECLRNAIKGVAGGRRDRVPAVAQRRPGLGDQSMLASSSTLGGGVSGGLSATHERVGSRIGSQAWAATASRSLT
jgi:hypothetical protein